MFLEEFEALEKRVKKLEKKVKRLAKLAEEEIWFEPDLDLERRLNEEDDAA